MILSILTPSVPPRLQNGKLAKLCAQVEKQIGTLAVEYLVFVDNKKRTVGEKRDALLRLARGDYVAFVDDDDWVSDDYVASLMTAMHGNPDVITFLQEATVNDEKGIVEFHLGNENESFKPNSAGVTRRNAWHVCAWRRSLAIQSHFPSSNYGEDWAYAQKLCAIPDLKEAHIDKVLHYYRHSTATTEAPAGS